MGSANEILKQSTVNGTTYWLFKSEPSCYSIDDLQQDTKTIWVGVRNYQARNFMRDSMRVNDMVLFYHSNSKPPGVVGVAKVSKIGVVDPEQFNPQSDYFDPKATIENPRWYCVEIMFVKKQSCIFSLGDIKKHPILQTMLVAQPGNRLSIVPILKHEFEILSQ